ncbi:hypothetical protein K439DRAFT_1612909 [Ramaria rubella]|nr:hypothetical protein K439DRAFT_1612909 [Ramaria rubella]
MDQTNSLSIFDRLRISTCRSAPPSIPHPLPTSMPFLPLIPLNNRLRGCRTFEGKSVMGLQCFATYYINTKADLQVNSIVLNETGSNLSYLSRNTSIHPECREADKNCAHGLPSLSAQFVASAFESASVVRHALTHRLPHPSRKSRPGPPFRHELVLGTMHHGRRMRLRLRRARLDVHPRRDVRRQGTGAAELMRTRTAMWVYAWGERVFQPEGGDGGQTTGKGCAWVARGEAGRAGWREAAAGVGDQGRAAAQRAGMGGTRRRRHLQGLLLDELPAHELVERVLGRHRRRLLLVKEAHAPPSGRPTRASRGPWTYCDLRQLLLVQRPTEAALLLLQDLEQEDLHLLHLVELAIAEPGNAALERLGRRTYNTRIKIVMHYSHKYVGGRVSYSFVGNACRVRGYKRGSVGSARDLGDMRHVPVLPPACVGYFCHAGRLTLTVMNMRWRKIIG